MSDERHPHGDTVVEQILGIVDGGAEVVNDLPTCLNGGCVAIIVLTLGVAISPPLDAFEQSAEGDLLQRPVIVGDQLGKGYEVIL